MAHHLLNLCHETTPFGVVIQHDFTGWGIHQLVDGCCNPGMSLIEHRRRVLALLVERDGLAVFARRVGKPDSQISDMIAGRKSFGEKIRRTLEERYAPHLPAGWMDLQKISDYDNPDWDALDGHEAASGEDVGAPSSQQSKPHVDQGRLARLKGKASPRSLAILKRLEAAIVRGSLTEDDLALLEQTAAHIEKVRPTKD